MPTISIPSTSVAMFKTSVAPTGWTKVTADDDVAIRVTSGTASSGGVNSFTSTFTTLTPAGTVNINSFTINTTTTSVAAHTHTSGRGSYGTSSGTAENSYSAPRYNFLYGPPGTMNTGANGGGTGHSHASSLSGAITATGSLNFDIKYIDMIIAQRD